MIVKAYLRKLAATNNICFSVSVTSVSGRTFLIFLCLVIYLNNKLSAAAFSLHIKFGLFVIQGIYFDPSPELEIIIKNKKCEISIRPK